MISLLLSTCVFLWYFLKWFIARYTRSGISDSVACLVGKTAIVTGGNSGIGLTISTLLASRGCRVIIADVANSEESKKNIIQKTGNPNIVIKHIDLSSLQSVRDFADDLKKTEKKIDILINNAGVGACRDICSKDGLNGLMQINYFGSFLLTHLLLDLLRASGSARIVFTTSFLSRLHDLNLETLNMTKYEPDHKILIKLYANSKLCNTLAARGFAEKLQKYGITANSVDPGVSRTPIYRYYGKEYPGSFWSTALLQSGLFMATNEFIAAQTSFHVATSEKLKSETGQIFFRCEPLDKSWHWCSKKLCESIWQKSEELVQLKPEERLS